jgi:monothiol glutaredoxin
MTGVALEPEPREARPMSSADDRIQSLIDRNKVLLFMKGNRAIPMCGFSAAVVQVLDRANVAYETVDVLQDPEIREGVKAFSNWPTIPQLYVSGKFVGGCDIVREMDARGELAPLLRAATGDR